MKILDIGCGTNPYMSESEDDEIVHLDVTDLSGVDVVWDLNNFPYPFKDNEFDMVIAYHVLEHLDNVVKVMGELWRILKPKGIVKIRVPYYTHLNAVIDITHRHVFTFRSFDYFDINSYLHYEVRYPFKILRKELIFDKFLFFGKLIFSINPSIYEHFFSYLLPARELRIEMETIK